MPFSLVYQRQLLLLCNVHRTPPPDSYSVSTVDLTLKPARKRLHWLPVHFRIIYKIATLMRSVLHRRCPQYLLDIISFNDGTGRRCLRSTTTRAAVVQRTRSGHNSVTERFRFVAPPFGTAYPRRCVSLTISLSRWVLEHFGHSKNHKKVILLNSTLS